MKEIIIICALTKNRVIGNLGKIPWYIKEDFELFKKFTTDNVVIMGRKTFLSLPEKFRPLPNRINIVISKNLDFEIEKNYKNFFVFNDLKNAIEFSKKKFDKKIFLIGGKRIYEEGLNYCSRLYLSFVKKEYAGDTYFPKFDEKNFKIIEEKNFDEFDFKIFERCFKNII